MSSNAAPTRILLAQPLSYRIAFTASASLIGVLGVIVIVISPLLWVLGLVFIAIGLIGGIRCARNAAIIDGDRLHLRGVFVSRTLRRADISSVDRFPFIDWDDAQGISHQSSVSAFLGSNSSAWAAGHRRDASRTLHQWLDAGPERAGHNAQGGPRGRE
jgi:hypothetical protein